MLTQSRLFFAVLLGCALANSACTFAESVAVDPSVPRVAYYQSEIPSTTRSEREFETSDGAVLGYIAHEGAAPRAAIVYLHGIESHSGWFDAAADGLCDRGYDVYCLDRRGSGINRENRGFTSGYVDEAQTLLDDIHDFVEPLHDRYPQVFVTGLSWGGKLALAYGMTYPQDPDGLVLITPGLVALVDKSWYSKLGILYCNTFSPTSQYTTPIEPEMFTSDPEYLEKMEADPLRLRYASARFFWESRGLDGFVEEHVEEHQLPILLFLAGQDRIIDNAGVLELLQRNETAPLETVTYEDQTHSVQFDAVERLVQDMDRWLKQRIAQSAAVR